MDMNTHAGCVYRALCTPILGKADLLRFPFCFPNSSPVTWTVYTINRFDTERTRRRDRPPKVSAWVETGLVREATERPRGDSEGAGEIHPLGWQDLVSLDTLQKQGHAVCAQTNKQTDGVSGPDETKFELSSSL